MSKGGFRPNSGRKKGSIPWNVGKIMSEDTKLKISLSKKGKTAWNKGLKMPIIAAKMIGNKNGHFGKGKIMSIESRKLMRLAKYNLYSKLNPTYSPLPRNKRIAENGGFHSNREWETLKFESKFTCLSCKLQEPVIKLTRDHVVPLLLGGTNDITNIQPLCFKCNREKHTKTIRY